MRGQVAFAVVVKCFCEFGPSLYPGNNVGTTFIGHQASRSEQPTEDLASVIANGEIDGDVLPQVRGQLTRAARSWNIAGVEASVRSSVEAAPGSTTRAPPSAATRAPAA